MLRSIMRINYYAEFKLLLSRIDVWSFEVFDCRRQISASGHGRHVVPPPSFFLLTESLASYFSKCLLPSMEKELIK